jgi:nucleotide-sensitive chloride channel 1A
MSSLRHITTAPSSDDFTPLQEHQQQTPATFFGAKPVLYSHHAGLTISAPKASLQSDDAFANFSSEPEGASEDDVLVNNVEAWVNAECAASSCNRHTYR